MAPLILFLKQVLVVNQNKFIKVISNHESTIEFTIQELVLMHVSYRKFQMY